MDKLSMITLLLARAYTDKKTSEVPAVIQYKGVTTTELYDGATTNPITINGNSYTAVDGDVVFYQSTAYAYDGSVWQATMSLAQIITVLEDLEDKIGDLDDLTTETKTSVVAAIDELVTALGAITDGQSIDSFSDVETALANICDDANIDSFADVVTALGNKVDKVQGKGLSANDYTNEDKAIVGGVTAALATKQNATDNNLTTTSKTVVGAVNELKSGLTTLDTEVNGDSTTYPYADVITIEDAVPANVADCNVKIEPVQDLHGYGHPWVGGAGKNKAKPKNYSSDSYNGTTYNDVIEGAKIIDDVVLPAGNYIVSIKLLSKPSTTRTLTIYKTGDVELCYFVELNNKTIDTVYTTTFSLSEETTVYGKSWGAGGGEYKIQIQLEEGSTATDYAPYENICPISGHTEASVQRDGKNWFDPSVFADSVADIMTYKSYKVPNGTYTMSTPDFPAVSNITNIFFMSGIRTVATGGNSYDDGVWASHSKSITVTDGYYTVAYRSSITQNTNNPSNYKWQIERGETATDYVPYAGKTYTIALGDTIYGGTVDFDSGVMTVDRVKLTKNTSTMNNDSPDYPGWKNAGIKQYIGSNVNGSSLTNTNVGFGYGYETRYNADIVDLPISFYGITQDEWKALAIDVEFIVELATPTTIQLTPQQIQLLKGQNTLTASTGDISVTVNGVSGAIGAVQEQVNELETRVAIVENNVTTKAVFVTGTITNDAGTQNQTLVNYPSGFDRDNCTLYGLYQFSSTSGAWYPSPDKLVAVLGLSNIILENSDSSFTGRSFKFILVKSV